MRRPPPNPHPTEVIGALCFALFIVVWGMVHFVVVVISEIAGRLFGGLRWLMHK